MGSLGRNLDYSHLGAVFHFAPDSGGMVYSGFLWCGGGSLAGLQILLLDSWHQQSSHSAPHHFWLDGSDIHDSWHIRRTLRAGDESNQPVLWDTLFGCRGRIIVVYGRIWDPASNHGGVLDSICGVQGLQNGIREIRVEPLGVRGWH